MAKWSDIAQSPEYRQLPAEEKEKAKQYFFKKVILPEVPKGETKQAWEYFHTQARQMDGSGASGSWGEQESPVEQLELPEGYFDDSFTAGVRRDIGNKLTPGQGASGEWKPMTTLERLRSGELVFDGNMEQLRSGKPVLIKDPKTGEYVGELPSAEVVPLLEDPAFNLAFGVTTGLMGGIKAGATGLKLAGEAAKGGIDDLLFNIPSLSKLAIRGSIKGATKIAELPVRSVPEPIPPQLSHGAMKAEDIFEWQYREKELMEQKTKTLWEAFSKRFIAADSKLRRELEKTQKGQDAVWAKDRSMGSLERSRIEYEDVEKQIYYNKEQVGERTKIIDEGLPTEREMAEPVYRYTRLSQEEVKITNNLIAAQRIAEIGDVKYKRVKDTIADKIAQRMQKYADEGNKEKLEKMLQKYDVREDGIYRRAQIKHPTSPEYLERKEPFTSQDARQYLKAYMTPERLERIEAFHNQMRYQLKKLHEAELISRVEYEALMKKGMYYSPRQVLDYIDPGETVISSVSGKPITVADSGLKALDEGSYKAMELDSSKLLSETINRTNARIMKNEANKKLYQYAVENSKNKMFRIASSRSSVKPDEVAISVRMADESGQVGNQYLIAKREWGEYWVTSDPQITQDFGAFLENISGSKILRAMATGLNPEFALTNFPRDVVHAWLVSGQYSKYLPKAAGEMTADLATVLSDVVRRKGIYKDYILNGGGMPLLTHQGQLKTHHIAIRKMQEFMGFVGETSELVVRCAVMKRAMRNGHSMEDAVAIARNTIDFGQGGSYAKAIDKFCPYFNAAIQGMRTIGHAAHKNPGEFVFKVSQLAMMYTMLNVANRIVSPEAFKNIDSKEKSRNFIVALSDAFSFHDRNGEKRWRYFRIPIDQTIQPILVAVDALFRKALFGDEIDGAAIAHSLRQMLPFPESPAFNAVMGYLSNVDFWLMEEIWKGRSPIEASDEYNLDTHPALVELGNIGLSPERSEYFLQQFFTRGNIWTTLLGAAADELFAGVDMPTREQTVHEWVNTIPGIRKVLHTTSPYGKADEYATEAERRVNTERIRRDRELDRILAKHDDPKDAKGELRDFLRKQPPDEIKRLMGRFKTNTLKYEPVDNPTYWRRMLQLPPEARAEALYKKWNDATSTEERRKLLKEGAYLRALNPATMKEFMQYVKGRKQ